MSLKFKYYCFIIFLHAGLTVLLYFLFTEKKALFLASELLVLISLYFSFYFYKNFMFPFQLLESGKNVIQEEDFTIKYIPTGNKEIDQLIHVYNNMIDKLREEKTKSAEQSYFLENLIESSPLGMIIMDYNKKVDIINETARGFLESSKVEGKKLNDLDTPLALHLANMQTNDEYIFSPDGLIKYKCKIHQVIHKGFPRQFILIEELTKDILKAEKEAYGKVIRMMAHEVNNSMGAVNSILDSIQDDFQSNNVEPEETEKYLRIAIDRNRKLGKFTNNFADVIRLSNPLLSKVDLNKILENSLSYYNIFAKEKQISIHSHFHSKPVFIIGDKIQLEQAFSNMIKNSIESIVTNGTINIYTSAESRKVIIEDDGAGISDEVKEKLFKPFFSTKADGQGIGLMLIREILQSHEAKFKLYTDPTTLKTNFEVEFTK